MTQKLIEAAAQAGINAADRAHVIWAMIDRQLHEGPIGALQDVLNRHNLPYEVGLNRTAGQEKAVLTINLSRSDTAEIHISSRYPQLTAIVSDNGVAADTYGRPFEGRHHFLRDQDAVTYVTQWMERVQDRLTGMGSVRLFWNGSSSDIQQGLDAFATETETERAALLAERERLLAALRGGAIGEIRQGLVDQNYVVRDSVGVRDGRPIANLSIHKSESLGGIYFSVVERDSELLFEGREYEDRSVRAMNADDVVVAIERWHRKAEAGRLVMKMAGPH